MNPSTLAVPRSELSGADWHAGQETSGLSSAAMLSADDLNERWQIRSSHGGVAFLAKHNYPWVGPTIKGLAALLALGPDWDSYGAATIDLRRVQAAGELLGTIMQPETPTPTVVPTSGGGVQLEWHEVAVDLEIEIVSRQRYLVAFEDHRSGDEWEGEITSNFGRLVRYISMLRN